MDADPQCNLTGLILGYKKYIEIEDFYKNGENRNLRDGLAPAFESMPQLIKPIECIEVEGREGLFLLPGHIKLAEYDVTLGIAQSLTGSIQTLKNLPGAINYLLDKTAEKLDADFIIIDMSPSLSSINQNLLMISDYFIIPTSPDYYSVMALDSLTTILNKWHQWSETAKHMDILQNATYPYPQKTPIFLGSIVQRYKLKNGRASKGFRHWVNEVNNTVNDKLVPQLEKLNMLLPDDIYNTEGKYCLAEIPDFNTLIATSQEEQTPVYALTDSQLKLVGDVLKNTKKKVNEFNKIFNDIVEKLVGMIDNESIN